MQKKNFFHIYKSTGIFLRHFFQENFVILVRPWWVTMYFTESTKNIQDNRNLNNEDDIRHLQVVLSF